MLSTGRHVLIAVLALQPAATPSVWDGVYTAAQAERGRTVYEARCSRCHGSDLRGVNGSSLAGDAFMLHWEGRTVERLVRRIHDTMPPDAAGSLTDRDAVDAVAYVLQRNGLPEGSNELALEPAAAAGIEIRSGAGQTVVRTGALVQAIGCLTASGDNGWVLTDATEPAITVLDAPASPNGAATATRGAQTIALMNVFPNPAAHAGHTMRVKGFLVRAPAADRINVVALELVEPRCGR